MNAAEKLKALKAMQRKTSGIRARSVAEACDELGIGKRQYERWNKAYKQEGTDALEPKSRRPKKLARKTPEKMEKLIQEMAKSGDFKSPAEITRDLKSQGHRVSNKMVGKVLASADMCDYPRDRNTGKLIGKRKYIRFYLGKLKP